MKRSAAYRKANAELLSAKASSPERRAYAREWWKHNGDAIRETRRQQAKTPEGRARTAELARARRIRSPQARVRANIRSRINLALKQKYRSPATEALLGCTVAEFVAHIESGWTPGMSWGNYGLARGQWNIDHIVPCASFDLFDPAEQRRCFHFSNCRPMWASENASKGARMIEAEP